MGVQVTPFDGFSYGERADTGPHRKLPPYLLVFQFTLISIFNDMKLFWRIRRV